MWFLRFQRAALRIRVKKARCAKMSAFVMAFDKFMLTHTRAGGGMEVLYGCMSVLCVQIFIWVGMSGTRFAKYQVNFEAETPRGSETDKEQIKNRR